MTNVIASAFEDVESHFGFEKVEHHSGGNSVGELNWEAAECVAFGDVIVDCFLEVVFWKGCVGYFF